MRHLDIPGMTNLRDVGGLPTGPGRQIRTGLLMRSEAPLRLTPEALAQFTELGLRTVVDLRGDEESQTDPTELQALATVTPVPIPERINANPLPVLEQILARELAGFGIADLKAIYLAMLDKHPHQFGTAVRALAAPDALPALVHCKVGKDRTGLVIAMVLDVVGVPREHLLRDYEVSTERRAFRRVVLAPAFAAAGARIEDADGLFSAPREALEHALHHLEDRHGSVRGFLTGAAGVPDVYLDQLTERLTEPC